MTTHGTRSRYQAGCRCLPCRAANAAYRSYGRRGVPVYAHAARAHLVELQARGIGRHQVAKLSGVSEWMVQRIRSGAIDQVGSEIASRLLAVPAIPAPHALIPSWPSRRLVHHLCREGFTKSALAARFRIPTELRPCQKVRAVTAARVRAVCAAMECGWDEAQA